MLGINLFFIPFGQAQKTQTTQPIDLSSPPEGVFEDQYYSLYLMEAKCGWARMQFERQGQTIHTMNRMHMEIGRDTTVIQIDLDSQCIETLKGKPVSFESRVTMANSLTVYKGDVENNVVTMEIVKPNASVKYRFKISPDVVMDWGNHVQTMKHLKKPDTKFMIRSLDPSLGQNSILETQTFIGKQETIKVHDKEISGIKIISVAEKLGPMPITSYVDPIGRMLYTEMQMGFAKVQIVAEDKKQATTNISPKEFFTQSLIKMQAPMPTISDKPMSFRITYTGKETMPIFPETSIQTVVGKKEKVQILRIDPAHLQTGSDEIQQPPAAAMASSSFVNLKDPILIDLAKQAAGSAKSPEATAKNLCRFVHEYIKDKNLATPFASASEIARSKTGDCSEHAVLMTALARINKIPARAVMGLVYTPTIGEYGAFGYHMWTQVWLNGQWVDMDPTFDEVRINPAHIAINFCDLADDSLQTQAAKLIQFIGQLKIEVEKESK
jgi:hypothetical protein